MTALLLAVLLGLSPAARAAEDISVAVSGRVRAPLLGYKIGDRWYLSAKEAGAVYGGQVYWYPVAGRVQMSFRGRAVQLFVDSDEARAAEGTLKLEAPVLLRSSRAFIPISFFLSEEFVSLSGHESVFNPRTRSLTVERAGTIGSPRWFSYKGHTRFSLEVDKRLSYSANARGVGGLEVAFPLGVLESSESAEIDDGLVQGFVLRQEPKLAKLSIRLAEPGLKWRVRELNDPRRIVVDIYEGEPPLLPDSPPARETAPRVTKETPARPADPDQPRSSAPAKSAGPAVLAHRDGKARRKIVVDPGHGGKDPGARGRRGVLEKEIALAAALELAKLLKQEGSFEILLTRSDDTFVPLADRSRLANEFGADLFVSLHCNANPNSREEGFEVYFLSEKASDPEAARLADFENSVLELEGKDPRGEAAAAALLGELAKTENINASSELAGLLVRSVDKRVDLNGRGVKQAGFYVLRGTHAPAVLVEMAFLSNRKDESKLESRRFRRKLVDGLYAGILEFSKRQGWTAAPRDGS